jgi:hypothetical protein
MFYRRAKSDLERNKFTRVENIEKEAEMEN